MQIYTNRTLSDHVLYTPDIVHTRMYRLGDTVAFLPVEMRSKTPPVPAPRTDLMFMIPDPRIPQEALPTPPAPALDVLKGLDLYGMIVCLPWHKHRLLEQRALRYLEEHNLRPQRVYTLICCHTARSRHALSHLPTYAGIVKMHYREGLGSNPIPIPLDIRPLLESVAPEVAVVKESPERVRTHLDSRKGSSLRDVLSLGTHTLVLPEQPLYERVIQLSTGKLAGMKKDRSTAGEYTVVYPGRYILSCSSKELFIPHTTDPHLAIVSRILLERAYMLSTGMFGSERTLWESFQTFTIPPNSISLVLLLNAVIHKYGTSAAYEIEQALQERTSSFPLAHVSYEPGNVDMRRCKRIGCPSHLVTIYTSLVYNTGDFLWTSRHVCPVSVFSPSPYLIRVLKDKSLYRTLDGLKALKSVHDQLNT